jgi:hypothetical protein
MKTKSFLAAGLVVLLLAGCYTPSSKMNHVQIGMSEADAVKVLGQPVSRGENKDGSVTLYYSLQEIFGSPPMPYSVHLTGGKVESYGRSEVDSPQRTTTPIIVPMVH